MDLESAGVRTGMGRPSRAHAVRGGLGDRRAAHRRAGEPPRLCVRHPFGAGRLRGRGCARTRANSVLRTRLRLAPPDSARRRDAGQRRAAAGAAAVFCRTQAGERELALRAPQPRRRELFRRRGSRGARRGRARGKLGGGRACRRSGVFSAAAARRAGPIRLERRRRGPIRRRPTPRCASVSVRTRRARANRSTRSLARTASTSTGIWRAPGARKARFRRCAWLGRSRAAARARVVSSVRRARLCGRQTVSGFSGVRDFHGRRRRSRPGRRASYGGAYRIRAAGAAGFEPGDSGG